VDRLASESGPAVQVTGLAKSFGDVRALDGVAVTVERGEMFGFIGPDGAGKTTLFRILATLLLPDAGEAQVLGLDVVDDYRALRRLLGYMPGRFSLYPDLTVEENLSFFATVFGTTIAAQYELIRDIYVQLEPFRGRRAGALSGGMKQKLALCCALVHRPELLLLDEPTTGVDAVSRREFWDLLARLRAEGLTIVVSTPYMDEADRCDRVALVQQGRLLDVDRPAAIAAHHDRPLLAVRADDRYRLIGVLRAYEHAAAVYPFGEVLHYTDQRPEQDAARLAGDVAAYLREAGLGGVEVTPIRAGIEDRFMALMGGATGTAS
jgi:ABC-2 type transport system ATP-binding protein